jgi:uncharacterized protein YbcC (UPF0753/DUF2309 family)
MTDTSLLRLADDVAAAARVVAPSWPLSSVIAVNPLAGFEDLPFAQALDRAEALFGTHGHLTLGELRHELRCGRITDAALRSALHRAVPTLADAAPIAIGGSLVAATEVVLADLIAGADDPEPSRTSQTVIDQLEEREPGPWRSELDLIATEHCLQGEAFDGDALATLRQALDDLRVPAYAQRAYLEAHLAALPGWAAHLRWAAEHGDPDALAGYLAVRVRAEAQLVAGRAWFHADGPVARPAAASLRDRAAEVALVLGATTDEHDAIAAVLTAVPGPSRALIWLDAYERCVHDPLLAAIAAGDDLASAGGGPGAPLVDDEVGGRGDPADRERLVAHVITCIDVRSEGLRRALEATGPYRTHGYAGFFGLFAHLDPITGGAGTDACPVLVAPARTLTEVADDGADDVAARAVERQRMAAGAADAWRAAKHHPIAPLALAEGAGWLAGPVAAARTAAPRLTGWLHDRVAGRRPRGVHHDRSAVPLAEQAALVRAIWHLGLAAHPASLVVLCGHGSRVDNNPMESALACGACGGNAGGPNARIVAAMANDPAVRDLLAAEGTPIDPATWFVAAEHDTAADRVEVLDRELVPDAHLDALHALERDLELAGACAALDRARSLPGARLPGDHHPSHGDRARRRALRAVRSRGRDWAEPVAELGLAGNAAFIVGPRSLTEHLDLRRRAFLHSYEASLDPTGATLSGILTAPLVVGQWINAQYYFSTTDPEVFGAGSKAVHNVVGDIGVLSGPGGDLRRGLPLQSVRAGDRLLHEPVRLLAVVQGRLEHIDAAIDGSATLQQLIGNGWISLVARAAPGDGWQQRTGDGWVPREVEADLPGVDARGSEARWLTVG